MARKHPQGYELAIVRIRIPNEHEDNDRFSADCEKWFGQEVITLSSDKYADCWDVWERERYLAGIDGAPCTRALKVNVRKKFAAEWGADMQAFGFTSEEVERANTFRMNNPELGLITPLITAGLSKGDCLAMVERAGIELPAMYRLGYRNNNCIGCVKGGAGYWNKIRDDFPGTFARMADLESRLGVKLIKLAEGRVSLEELDPGLGKVDDIDIECSLFCAIAEQDIKRASDPTP